MKNKLKLKAVARQTGSFRAQGNELMLYGIIGDYWDGLNSEQIVRHIKSMKGDITVKINSPGGDVFDGIAIMNALKDHSKEGKGKVSVIVDALAASIASVVAMAGDSVTVAEGAFLMIHNPWTIALGEADDFRHTADLLDQITETIVGIYARKTNMVGDAVKAMMAAETWISGKDAVSMGFATASTESEVEPDAVKNFDLSVFNNVPEGLRIAAKAARPQTVRELEHVLRNAGYSRTEAKAVASAGLGALEQREAETEIDSEKLLAAIESRIKSLQE